jgi:protein disulfide-isomerase A1
MIDILLIHAHWCGHCKALMPEWQKMKQQLKSNTNIAVHEIETGDSNKEQRLEEFRKKHKNGESVPVKGFPTIVRFENGEMTEYRGQRTAAELAKWAQKHKLSGGAKKRTKRVRRKRSKTCKKCTLSWF